MVFGCCDSADIPSLGLPELVYLGMSTDSAAFGVSVGLGVFGAFGVLGFLETLAVFGLGKGGGGFLGRGGGGGRDVGFDMGLGSGGGGGTSTSVSVSVSMSEGYSHLLSYGGISLVKANKRSVSADS